jgi:hypothetical protein
MRQVGSRYSLGAKERFGAEFTLLRTDPAPFGELTLFVNGSPIAAPAEPDFIYPLVLDLEGLVTQPPVPELTDRVFGLDSHDAWEVLQSAGAPVRFSPGEMFDEHDVFAIRRGDQVRFLSKSVQKPKSESPAPHDASVALRDVALLARELRNLYEELRLRARQRREN